MICAEIRRMLSEAYQETEFFPRTNETYYPAAWKFGEGAGDAETSDYYDVRIAVAADHVAEVIGLGHWQGTEALRLADASIALIAAFRAQQRRDEIQARIEAEADAEETARA